MFLLPEGAWNVAGTVAFSDRCWWPLARLVRVKTHPDHSLPAPAISPLSVSQSPGPSASAAPWQRVPASPSGHFTIESGIDKREAGSSLSAVSVCPCSYPFPAAFLAASQHLADQPQLQAQPPTQGPLPPPAHASAKGGPLSTLFSITHRGSASLTEPWWIQSDVSITSQRCYNWLYLEFVDWTEDQILTAYWLEWWKISKK